MNLGLTEVLRDPKIIDGLMENLPLGEKQEGILQIVGGAGGPAAANIIKHRIGEGDDVSVGNEVVQLWERSLGIGTAKGPTGVCKSNLGPKPVALSTLKGGLECLAELKAPLLRGFVVRVHDLDKTLAGAVIPGILARLPIDKGDPESSHTSKTAVVDAGISSSVLPQRCHQAP